MREALAVMATEIRNMIIDYDFADWMKIEIDKWLFENNYKYNDSKYSRPAFFVFKDISAQARVENATPAYSQPKLSLHMLLQTHNIDW